jgi:hypothetical protein
MAKAGDPSPGCKFEAAPADAQAVLAPFIFA